MARPLRILCASSWVTGDWRWIAPALDRDAFSWRFFLARPGRIERHAEALRIALRAVRSARRSPPDLFVTHGPKATIYLAWLARLARLRIPHFAYSFHLDRNPSPRMRWLVRSVASQVDRFVVYSRAEAEEYQQWFGVPAERFEAAQWGMRPPEIAPDQPPLERQPYACAIGASDRDYATVFAALERLPHVPLVAVLHPRNLEGLEVPAQVRIRSNLPFDQMQNVLAHARLLVHALPRRSRSGHGVLVQAMWLGKPCVVSDVPGMRDYVPEGRTAWLCPPEDPDALASAIDTLWSDPERGRELGTRAREFAREHCSEEAVVAHFLGLLRRQGLPVPTLKPGS